jgi:hypothetical protein
MATPSSRVAPTVTFSDPVVLVRASTLEPALAVLTPSLEGGGLAPSELQRMWPRPTAGERRSPASRCSPYLREQLIAAARRCDKAESMAAVEQALAGDPGPGLSEDTIRSGLQELRGE